MFYFSQGKFVCKKYIKYENTENTVKIKAKTPHLKCKYLAATKAEISVKTVEELLYGKGDGALQQVAQRAGGSLILGDIEDQAGQGSKQPHLAVAVPVLCWEVGLYDL